jgi:hypothetical protein
MKRHIAAFGRRVLHHLTASWCIERTYHHQEHGWAGWVELPGFGAVAFRRNDGTTSYRW